MIRHVIIAVVISSLSYEATAQEQSIQEVIVTAQKREENLQQIPISIAVFDADSLESRGIDDIGDIGIRVPNVRMSAFPYSTSTIRLFMRGVGSNETQVTQDPGVGVYFNGIYVGRSAGLSMDVADLERVEILRGPQGTLYGRNTTGGAINLITAAPKGELAFKQELSAGNLGYWKSRTQIDLPQFGDLSVKAAYVRSSRDGLVRNSGAGRDFGEDDKSGVLLALRWEPSDNFSANYVFDHSDLDFTANYYQATNGVGPATGDGFGSLAPLLGFFGGPSGVSVPLQPDRIRDATLPDPFQAGEAQIDGHALTLAWDLGPATLKSLTGYREISESDYQDFSANPTFTFFANEPVQVAQHQVSQELQLIGGSEDKRFEYVAGLYYFRERGREFEVDRADVLFAAPPIFMNDIIITQRLVKAENTTKAAYGQLSYGLTNRLKVTGGARYTEDKREATKDDIFFTRFAVGNQTYSRFTPSVAVDFQATDDLMAYAKVVSGYKSGGYNLRAGSADDFERGFAEENLISYEVGAKTQWLDNRLRVNAAVFRSNYDDIQVDIPLLFNPSQTTTFNAGKARIQGVELDLLAAPIDGLLLSLSYGYLDAEFTRVIDPQNGQDITAIYVLPSAPKSGVSAGVAYTFPSFSFGTLTANLDYSWQDDIYTQGNARIVYGAAIEAYGLLDARLTLANVEVGKSQLKFSLWGNNLTDKEWQSDSVGSFRGFVADRIASFGTPRMYGVDVAVEF